MPVIHFLVNEHRHNAFVADDTATSSFGAQLRL